MFNPIFFLCASVVTPFAWKIEAGETITIAGYTFKKASGKTERGSDIIAWYTEDIALPAGPKQFNGLPGMILGVDANKAAIVFSAISIDKKAGKKALKLPAKGKKVTGAEFAKIQKN